MGFNSAFKGLKLLKTPGNGRLNNLNDPVLNVLSSVCILALVIQRASHIFPPSYYIIICGHSRSTTFLHISS